MNPPVNRALKDKTFDHIDHALGRPTWPLRESYRNYFAANSLGPEEFAFSGSPWWRRGGTYGRQTIFHVTDFGRQALAVHLAIIGADRVYEVSFDGHDARPVAAATPAKARYLRFLEISDTLPDLTFLDFTKLCRVRLSI